LIVFVLIILGLSNNLRTQKIVSKFLSL